MAKARINSVYCASDELFVDLETVKNKLSVHNLLCLFDTAQQWSRDWEAESGNLHRLEFFVVRLAPVVLFHKTELRRYLKIWRETPVKFVYKLMPLAAMCGKIAASSYATTENVDFFLEIFKEANAALKEAESQL